MLATNRLGTDMLHRSQQRQPWTRKDRLPRGPGLKQLTGRSDSECEAFRTTVSVLSRAMANTQGFGLTRLHEDGIHGRKSRSEVVSKPQTQSMGTRISDWSCRHLARQLAYVTSKLEGKLQLGTYMIETAQYSHGHVYKEGDQ